jgi:hypothetical protein
MQTFAHAILLQIGQIERREGTMICLKKVKTRNSLINRQVTGFGSEIIGKAVTDCFAEPYENRFCIPPTPNSAKGRHRPKRLRSLLEIKDLKWPLSECT